MKGIFGFEIKKIWRVQKQQRGSLGLGHGGWNFLYKFRRQSEPLSSLFFYLPNGERK